MLDCMAVGPSGVRRHLVNMSYGVEAHRAILSEQVARIRKKCANTCA